MWPWGQGLSSLPCFSLFLSICISLCVGPCAYLHVACVCVCVCVCLLLAVCTVTCDGEENLFHLPMVPHNLVSLPTWPCSCPLQRHRAHRLHARLGTCSIIFTLVLWFLKIIFLKFWGAKIPTSSEETQLGRNLGTLRANVDLIWSF